VSDDTGCETERNENLLGIMVCAAAILVLAKHVHCIIDDHGPPIYVLPATFKGANELQVWQGGMSAQNIPEC